MPNKNMLIWCGIHDHSYPVNGEKMDMFYKFNEPIYILGTSNIYYIYVHTHIYAHTYI